MSGAAPQRKGWCPGALRPMPAGDGLLLRVRPSAGRLSLDQAETLAHCAARFGNGVLEITSRANVQMRGVGEPGLAELQAALAAAGLLDRDDASEAARNIVASPLSDCDPQARIDLRPIVEALQTRLAELAQQIELPAKFGYVLDDGGAFDLSHVAADVRFVAQPEGGFAITLGGNELYAAQCAAGDAADALARLARAFSHAAAPGDRMRDVVARQGAARLFASAGLTRAFSHAAAPRQCAPTSGLGALTLGLFTLGDAVCLAAAPMFGRMSAAGFAALVAAARASGASDMRLTPWRTLIICRLRKETAALAASAAELGFLLEAGDPRLAIVACAGAPACAHAARDVQADALALAPYLAKSPGVALHISGCGKGCAHPAPTRVTLVARQAGYDWISEGDAKAAPARRGLSLADVATALAQGDGMSGAGAPTERGLA